MLKDDEREERIKKRHPDAPRLLAVDNEVVVPVNKVVHVLVTASDVIHNWTIPSFGSKVDAVPGRITATWFKADARKASSTASARSCAARTTPSCRSPCAS